MSLRLRIGPFSVGTSGRVGVRVGPVSWYGGGRRRRRRTSSKRSPSILGALFGLLILVGIVVAVVKATYHGIVGSNSPPVVYSGAQQVAGTANILELPGISAARVWCRWHDSFVQVHLTITNINPEAQPITVSPIYNIGNYGSHGGSVDGYRDITLLPNTIRSYLISAGVPRKSSGAVPGQPAITACTPQLS